ncbi:MAG: peptidylprolyl isomerase [Aridibacter famidurans]|nr:peptidylprolyl isomerase [Aridibacter famidurans]
MKLNPRFILPLLLTLAASHFAQTDPAPSPSPSPEARQAEKANQRPKEPERKPEPWDNADVKTMAKQCVSLETAKGTIVIEVYPESAPETVRNFLNLVSTGALDTTTFDRVVPGFVIQGGNLYTNENLTNDLRWRAIRTIPDEPNNILHERRIVSMARPDEPNSATTSFFILLRSADTLDGKFAAFGKVIRGFEVVEEINKADVEGEKPKEPVKIVKASVSLCGEQ